jgi:CheY-like chemotaxis protein
VEIQTAGDRAAALTRQLLAFSRRQMLQPQVLDINTLVRQFEKLLRRMISEDVELVTALAPDLHHVMVDPASVEQILVSLALNARDAMPKGGRLTIETANVELDDAYAVTHLTMTPGPYVMLAVADTGEGMDAATRARVFEPFFTTKEQGKGSGLGLATVYGIVKQSGGHLLVESEVGKGSKFLIYLPATAASVETSLPQHRAAGERGSETVLVVEHDATVRSLICDVLRRRGYQLLVAEDGAEAVRVADQHDAAIHLLVTNLPVPATTGASVADAVRKRRPETRVLFLQKPFIPAGLAKKVRSALETEPVKQAG